MGDETESRHAQTLQISTCYRRKETKRVPVRSSKSLALSGNPIWYNGVQQAGSHQRRTESCVDLHQPHLARLHSSDSFQHFNSIFTKRGDREAPRACLRREHSEAHGDVLPCRCNLNQSVLSGSAHRLTRCRCCMEAPTKSSSRPPRCCPAFVRCPPPHSAPRAPQSIDNRGVTASSREWAAAAGQLNTIQALIN